MDKFEERMLFDFQDPVTGLDRKKKKGAEPGEHHGSMLSSLIETIVEALGGSSKLEGKTVIDFGSGYGLVLAYFASKTPVKRVIGVELDEDIARKSRWLIQDNLDLESSSKIEVITGDLRDVHLPIDETSVFITNDLVFPIELRQFIELSIANSFRYSPKERVGFVFSSVPYARHRRSPELGWTKPLPQPPPLADLIVDTTWAKIENAVSWTNKPFNLYGMVLNGGNQGSRLDAVRLEEGRKSNPLISMEPVPLDFPSRKFSLPLQKDGQRIEWLYVSGEKVPGDVTFTVNNSDLRWTLFRAVDAFNEHLSESTRVFVFPDSWVAANAFLAFLLYISERIAPGLGIQVDDNLYLWDDAEKLSKEVMELFERPRKLNSGVGLFRESAEVRVDHLGWEKADIPMEEVIDTIEEKSREITGRKRKRDSAPSRLSTLNLLKVINESRARLLVIMGSGLGVLAVTAGKELKDVEVIAVEEHEAWREASKILKQKFGAPIKILGKTGRAESKEGLREGPIFVYSLNRGEQAVLGAWFQAKKTDMDSSFLATPKTKTGIEFELLGGTEKAEVIVRGKLRRGTPFDNRLETSPHKVLKDFTFGTKPFNGPWLARRYVSLPDLEEYNGDPKVAVRLLADASDKNEESRKLDLNVFKIK